MANKLFSSNSIKISIAPMLNYTNKHYRYLLRNITLNTILYTEMITTSSILYSQTLNSSFECNFNIENPVVLQLGSSNINDLIKSIKISLNYGYKYYNINVGCPSERAGQLIPLFHLYFLYILLNHLLHFLYYLFYLFIYRRWCIWCYFNEIT